jgi:hypothetical protein
LHTIGVIDKFIFKKKKKFLRGRDGDRVKGEAKG